MAKAKAKTRSADATSGANAAGVASYLTPAVDEVSTAEFVDRKSRFIAHLTHVESEDEANAFIENIRRQRSGPSGLRCRYSPTARPRRQ